MQIETLPTTEHLKEIYDAPYFAKGKYIADEAERREQMRRLFLLKRAGLKPGARLLDYGCAGGVFLDAAKSHYDVWGAEFSTDALSLAKKTLPNHADRLLALNELADFQSDFFDAIVLWDVPEHLPFPMETMGFLTRILKVGGILALSTPDIGALTARMMRKRWSFMTPPEHVGFFSSPSIKHLFLNLGLSPHILERKGKWVNLGFLCYKLGHVAPELFRPGFVSRMRSSPLAKKSVYVPSQDILYVAARRLATRLA